MNIVFLSYLKAFGIVTITALTGWFTAKLFVSKCNFNRSLTMELALGTAGTLLLLTAGIGKLGWQIQTWDGHSSAETMNDWLFFLLTIVGAWSLFTDIFIKYLETKTT